jgi:transglutaminase-like putative cysteine protease
LSATESTARRRMSITTILSTVFIMASIIWATVSFGLIQLGAVRAYPPHFEYDTIDYWPYTNDFAGGRSNWFEDVNYTSVPVNGSLPGDLLDHLDDPLFVVMPADPAQLWRAGSYDYYDGSNWEKSVVSTSDLSSQELIPAYSAPNQIYTVFFSATAGATVGEMELPTLFPEIRVIENSFHTWSNVSDTLVQDSPSRLLSYTLQTDRYGSLLFSPLIEGTTGEQVLVSFDISYETQNLANVEAYALPGGLAPGWTLPYIQTPALTTRVHDNISQFLSVGANAYEKALAVQFYFRNTFSLTIDQGALDNRPGTQEVTDWFLEQGGGLPIDFATAYCVFMRELGVPARLVKGYAIGDPDPVGDFRSLLVRHMTYWAEVFIPMSDGSGGEWIQVIPAPLPSDFGGSENPTNYPQPDVELLVVPSNGLYYAQIGTVFELSANITVEGSLITTPETIYFYDETDTEYIGSSQISQPPFLPYANITYVFPSNATVDFHIISASWFAPTLSITNYTSIYAVGQPVPMHDELGSATDGFVTSEIRDLNVSQGVDTHVAYWEDTLHVFGRMTVGGNPVNGSKYGNQYIQIMWDNTMVGNAHIGEDGRYSYDVYLDPMNHSLMTVGPHEVWSWYLGDYVGGVPRLLPARSADNSTVTLWGRIGFVLYVSPDPAYGGASLTIEGTVILLNGTLLPLPDSVGVFFGTQANATRALNSTGGFSWTYIIPVSQPDGTYFIRANWTSSYQYIAGNWSALYPLEVGAGGAALTINQLPDPVIIGWQVTFTGRLTHVSNGTGIAGQWIDIWWDNGTHVVNLGGAWTNLTGHYEFNYTILSPYKGPITYWSNFSSPIPFLANAESLHLHTTVKGYDPLITILVDPDPAFLLQTLTIQGNATLPEAGGYPLQSEVLTIWMQNGTGVYNLGITTTNITGGYVYYYPIPLNQATEIVYLWANYTSPYYNVENAESLPHEPVSIEATGTLLSVFSNSTQYYLNETALIFGHLQFDNGTPLSFQAVYIHWENATGTFVFEKQTDAFGDYRFLYNLTINDAVGLVNVNVTFTSWTPLVENASAVLTPAITLRLYVLELTMTVPTQLHVDENLYIEGYLTYQGGGPPLPGESVELWFYNTSSGMWELLWAVTTNSTGGFNTTVFFLSPQEGLVQFACVHWATSPLNDDAYAFFDVNRKRYQSNLEITVLPNPVMQNETVSIHVYLYMDLNGSAITNSNVSIYWNNGTLYFLGNITTDGTGQGTLDYSGMDYDMVRTGIQVYAYFPETVYLGANETVHQILKLDQWQTEIVGVNVPVITYRLTETVVVTGYLQYVSTSGPYGGVTVELRLLGATLDTAVTASDGFFTLYWTIPGSQPLGPCDLEVHFVSLIPWIADSQASVPQITINAPGYIFVQFTVTPDPVYRTYNLNITGVVEWDNGSIYADSPVDLYWGEYSVTETLFRTVYTDSNGRFSVLQLIPGDTPLGDLDVWAHIEPAGYATSGESWVETVTVAVFSLVLTADVNTTTAYRGGSITFNGTLQFANGTPMVGYGVEIWWNGQFITSITINDPFSGAYSHAYDVQYTDDLGYISGWVEFVVPSEAFLPLSEILPDILILEYTTLILDGQPPDNEFDRGEVVTLTGYAENDISSPSEDVTVEVVWGVLPTGVTGQTQADGTFSIDFTIPMSWGRGTHTLTVTISSPYHDQQNTPITWNIVVFVISDLGIQVAPATPLAGETVPVYLELYDGDGIPLSGADIDIYLGSTLLGTYVLSDASGSTIQITVPASWAEGDGDFQLTAEYGGSSYIRADSDTTLNSVHVFTDVLFVTHTPSRIDPDQAFDIEVSLLDMESNPIVDRGVTLIINGTSYDVGPTDASGTVSYRLAGYPSGTILTYSITLTSSQVGDIVSDTFTIRIQTQGGGILQGTDLIIAGVLLVGAVIAVLAYLYIVKGMFRSTVISRGSIDIPTKLRNIKKLADAGKYGASITLAYRTFEQMCGAKMGSERVQSETAREYLDRVLQVISLDGPSVEKFVQTYEEARFSHHEMSRERYEEAVRIFTDIYPRIDSSTLVE